MLKNSYDTLAVASAAQLDATLKSYKKTLDNYESKKNMLASTIENMEYVDNQFMKIHRQFLSQKKLFTKALNDKKFAAKLDKNTSHITLKEASALLLQPKASNIYQPQTKAISLELPPSSSEHSAVLKYIQHVQFIEKQLTQEIYTLAKNIKQITLEIAEKEKKTAVLLSIIHILRWYKTQQNKHIYIIMGTCFFAVCLGIGLWLLIL